MPVSERSETPSNLFPLGERFRATAQIVRFPAAEAFVQTCFKSKINPPPRLLQGLKPRDNPIDRGVWQAWELGCVPSRVYLAVAFRYNPRVRPLTASGQAARCSTVR